jgi:predicted nucleic acid-binding protein
MKYVVDTSVMLKSMIPEVDSPKAIRRRDEYNNVVHVLIAPDLFPGELCNVLMMAERRGRINPGEASAFLVHSLQDLPRIFDSTPLLPRALVLALTYRQSVYDCLYVALAEREGCELVTADELLVKAVEADYPFVIRLSNLP